MSAFNLNEHNDLCVGIDLGTTNSVLATINVKPNGDVVSRVVDIPRSVDAYSTASGEAKLSTSRKPTLPSCVYYRQERNYEPLVGDFAKMQYPLRSHLVAKSIKSQMGKPLAEGLSPDIPDKTPAEISSRILKHMLQSAAKTYRCSSITDAVITVPANFDASMCKATRDAAEMAGIKVRNADGSERPVLLSEPNAVIYDLINQIHNGEISDQILDMSSPKRVLVFDLGGGTLDITMHEIQRRSDGDNIIKVDEIATNRYTLLGGDDFDAAIAKAMYDRYLQQYARHPNALAKLRKEVKTIMPQLMVHAEILKLELNDKFGEGSSDDDFASGWDDDESISTGGNMGGIGYAYDDTFTKEEVEDILAGFMARNLSYGDYRRIADIKDTRNIIYPILDVLKKAADKLGTPDVTVDAVIVNGGMSKFYMVTDRLKEFFGFDPIVALDPDQSVARGAAVYHYYLHKHEELQDDMRLVGQDYVGQSAGRPVGRDSGGYGGRAQTASWDTGGYGGRTQTSRDSGLRYTGSQSSFDREMGSRYTAASTYQEPPRRTAVQPKAAATAMIEWGRSILNEGVYLGAKNGAVQELVPTGAELPYMSGVMSGFRLEPGQDRMAIPIKVRNLDDTYRIIATGNIKFNRVYRDGAFVAFKVSMSSNKVLTMNAWTSQDIDGRTRIEEGTAKIAIDNTDKSAAKGKIAAPSGSILRPREEINNMLQLCMNFDRYKNTSNSSGLAKRIAACVTNICNAGNKEDFAPIILEKLQGSMNLEAKMRLFIVARRLGSAWSARDKRRLANACMGQLGSALAGFSLGGGQAISANIQAIYTLSLSDDMEQLSKLSILHRNPKYLQACLYTHGKTRSELPWLQEELGKDAKYSLRGVSNNIQCSAHAIGMALRKDLPGGDILSPNEEEKVVKLLCKVIKAGNLNFEELVCCILALGCICDQRQSVSRLKDGVLREVEELMQVRGLMRYYDAQTAYRLDRSCEVATKMLHGDSLNLDEERFLLTKLEL